MLLLAAELQILVLLSVLRLEYLNICLRKSDF